MELGVVHVKVPVKWLFAHAPAELHSRIDEEKAFTAFQRTVMTHINANHPGVRPIVGPELGEEMNGPSIEVSGGLSDEEKRVLVFSAQNIVQGVAAAVTWIQLKR